MVAEGYKEITLLGQNVNSYGKGLEEDINFAEILRRINKIEGIERVRFMTSHPKDLSDEVIDVIASCDKLCESIHLPVQSGSSRILKKMNRHYDREQYLELAKKIKERIPNVAFTTDIIVGFPGETAEDVEETIDVIREIRFDNAFTYIYSKRTGTPAASMENQVPEAEIKVQFDRLLKVVQEMSHSKTGKLENTIQEALVEEINEQDPSLMTGRLSNNALVHFKGDSSLLGKIVQVKLNTCHGFYYVGEAVNN
jgi:tRNA-2-methylthio-N6-dimethylallyladenosine synthase